MKQPSTKQGMVSKNTEQLLDAISGSIGGTPVNYDSYVPKVAVAGDDVTTVVTMYGKKLKIGFGLSQRKEKVIATYCGMLRFQKPNTFWVEHRHHKYIPMKEDTVIGVVANNFSEEYAMDIHSYSQATLPHVAFDGATKRSRPSLGIGSAVYCRVISTDVDLEPGLSCKAPASVARKDWSSGEAVFGELKGGYLFSVSLALATSLLQDDCLVLKCLASFFAFEIAVGMNGKVWVNAEQPNNIILITNAIKRSATLTDKELPRFILSLVETSKKMA